jgi:NAD(P)-dependent dehydrogenase (short-subunit alcohol dehydrogenase family)
VDDRRHLVKLAGKVALVFGGSSGLGRASAAACAEEGAAVVVADVDAEGGTQVAEHIGAGGGKATFVRTDITDEAAVAAAVQASVDEFGSLDILVTSVGAPSDGQESPWHFAIDLFLKGPYYACKHAVPHMEGAGGGSIVNIGSIASVTGGISTSVEGTGYPTAKHGLLGLTRTIALAYAAQNIRANVVCPGYIKTAMTRSLYEQPDGGRSLITEQLRVPLGRWGEPHEIGRVVAFLASDDAAYITGQPIVVDGGFMAR